MTVLYIIAYFVGLILVVRIGYLIINFLIKHFEKSKEKKFPYFKIKKKLEDDLLQAKFSGDWHNRQVINLHLIWLKTLNEIETRDSYGIKQDVSEVGLLSKLTLDDIKFPQKWKLDDFYCYPFSQEIILAYGKVLAENDYRGMFKPDSILPVPKEFIRKAILFTLDYFNLKESIYVIKDREKRTDNLNAINAYLDLSFINTGNEDLPKAGLDNYKVGNVFKERQKKGDILDNFKLIDWRTNASVHSTHSSSSDRLPNST